MESNKFVFFCGLLGPCMVYLLHLFPNKYGNFRHLFQRYHIHTIMTSLFYFIICFMRISFSNCFDTPVSLVFLGLCNRRQGDAIDILVTSNTSGHC